MSSDSPSTESRKAVRIGKYEILKHVATGGMGAVYRVRDTEDNRELALKVLTPDMAAKPAMLERFKREAKHAAKLRHDNIVTIYEFGESNGTYFIAMEFVDGIDLHEFITKKKGLEPEESRQIMLQAVKALQHAHNHGIIHRDIKPSNFLLTRKNGRVVVKMTDMGLAREVNNEEFRVTRAGTTVGTVDYIAPEQARDSGSADIRSDLYSLGCTWFHMLTGKPPFPEGGLAERLCKHMMDAPPDVRKFNPRISRELSAILNKLLAKNPDDRYQTPAELLAVLNTLTAVAEPGSETDTVAETAEEGEDESASDSSRRDTVAESIDEAPPRSGESAKKRIVGTRRLASPTLQKKIGSKTKPELKPDAAEEEDEEKPSKKINPMLYVAGGGVALLVLTVVLALATSGGPRKGKAKTDEQTAANSTPPAPKDPTPDPGPGPTPKDPGKVPVVIPNPVIPVKPTLKPLYKPARPIQFETLRKKIDEPWSKIAPLSGKVPVLRVVRTLDGQTQTYTTLQAACDAVKEEGAIIEICDNGPIYEVGANLTGKRVHMRAGKGYRPLLIWDVQSILADPKKKTKAFVFLAISKGSLTLEGLEIGLRWPDTAACQSIALLHATEADLTVSNCSFSVADPSKKGATLAVLSSPTKEVVRFRMSGCYARGTTLSILHSEALLSETLIENSLIVGGMPTLIRLKASDDRSAGLSLVGSTLVCGQNLLTVLPAIASDQKPNVDVIAWDCLFSRSDLKAGGELVSVTGQSANMKWEAINCLYTGWTKLLSAGSQTIFYSSISEWRKNWKQAEGDVAVREPWPQTPFHELVDKPASKFRTQESEDPVVCYASSTNPELPLGCHLDRLPSTRDNWIALALDRPLLTPEPVVDPGPPLEIANPMGKLYFGEEKTLDPVKDRHFDLGQHLAQLQKEYTFAERVVIKLSGTGEYEFTPVKIYKGANPRGTSLIIHVMPPPVAAPMPPPVGQPFEKPKPGEKPKPIVLKQKHQEDRSSEEPLKGLIDVENGSLELYNAEIRLRDVDYAKDLPVWMFNIRNGDLKLFHCRLFGPQAYFPINFQGLINFNGSGSADPRVVRTCQIGESLLLSNRDGIHLNGIGLRVQIQQSLIAVGGSGSEAMRKGQGGGNALVLEPGQEFKGQANTQLCLSRTTLGSRRACLKLLQPADQAVPTDQAILQTTECAFLTPFSEGKPGVLLGQGTALAQGIVTWQSSGDLLDPRLLYLVASDKAIPDKPQAPELWNTVWRYPSPAPREPLREVGEVKVQPELTQGGKGWVLAQFAMPLKKGLSNQIDKRAGVDPELLGLIKKK